MLEIYQTNQENLKNTNNEYPFNKLREGESFFVNGETCREASLRTLVSNASNKYGKTFKCIKHTKSNVFEVACISKSKSEATTFNIVESSAEAKAFTAEGTGKKKYFFDQIPEGMSCLVPIESANEASLRVAVSIWSRKIQGRFMLLRHDQNGVFEIYHLPPSQIKSVEIVEPSPQAIEKGRAFITAYTDEIEKRNRFLGRNPDDKNSIETTSYFTQPFLKMLTENEFLNLTCWLNDHVPSNISILVSFSSLLQHIPSINRGSFGNKEATDIINLLGKMNIGIEPDPRFGSFVPKPEQDVVLFRIGDNAPTSPSIEYSAATVVLHLASAVASADGYIDPAEERHLEEHLEAWLHLATDEKIRLRAHTQWLLSSFPGMNGVKERIELLKQDQRESLGRFLVGVAQADGYIDLREIRILTKIYEMLGLDIQNLYSHAHAAAVEPITVQTADFVMRHGYAIPSPPPKPTEGISLDMSSIEAKLADTEAVSAILNNIFAEVEPELKTSSTSDSLTSDVYIAGLDPESFTFMQVLASKHIWARDELEKLADHHSLMLDGTLDSINDASYDHFGGPFFEGDDPIEINSEFAKEITA